MIPLKEKGCRTQKNSIYCFRKQGVRKHSLCYVRRHMENTEKLKELFKPVLDECGVSLYELNWTGGHEKNLQVSIIKPDGSMDLDTCCIVSEKLSELLDREDPISSEYTLEVCSPGAEREIRDLSELKNMQGAYVYVRLKQAVNKKTEVTGEIIETDDAQIVIEYRDKAVKKKLAAELQNIDFIRMAVRI